MGRRGCCIYPGLEPCKTKGLGSQERGLRAQVTPQIQAGSLATDAVLAPFPSIQKSLIAKWADQETGASTNDVQAPLPPAYFLTQEWEMGAKRTLPVERAQRTSQASRASEPSQAQVAHQENALLLPPTPNPLTLLWSNQPCLSLISWRPWKIGWGQRSSGPL